MGFHVWWLLTPWGPARLPSSHWGLRSATCGPQSFAPTGRGTLWPQPTCVSTATVWDIRILRCAFYPAREICQLRILVPVNWNAKGRILLRLTRTWKEHNQLRGSTEELGLMGRVSGCGSASTLGHPQATAGITLCFPESSVVVTAPPLSLQFRWSPTYMFSLALLVLLTSSLIGCQMWVHEHFSLCFLPFRVTQDSLLAGAGIPSRASFKSWNWDGAPDTARAP